MHYVVTIHPLGEPDNQTLLYASGKNKADVTAALKLDGRVRDHVIKAIRECSSRFYEARVFVSITPAPSDTLLAIEAVRDYLTETVTLDTDYEAGDYVTLPDNVRPHADGQPTAAAVSINWDTLRPVAFNEINNPYVQSPPRRDLLTDVQTIAARAGWNEHSVIQQLALFIANETTDSQALINFLHAQEDDECSHNLV